MLGPIVTSEGRRGKETAAQLQTAQKMCNPHPKPSTKGLVSSHEKPQETRKGKIKRRKVGEGGELPTQSKGKCETEKTKQGKKLKKTR